MRRLLIISGTFYPDPMVAAVRMTQWSRYLPEFGWQPTILCRHYGHNATPEALASQVHPDVRVRYLNDAPAVASSVTQRPTLKQRCRSAVAGVLASFVVPDLSVRFWGAASTRALALRTIREVKPDAFLTTGPPHSCHDLGRWLAKESNVPWVADFRDPYVIDSRFAPSRLGRLRWRAHCAFEESVYRNAALTVHAIPIQARWSRRRYVFARDRVRILTNGLPLELVEKRVSPAAASKPGRKSIRVIGTIPLAAQLELARAVATLVQAGDDLELTLVGRISEGLPELQKLLDDRLVATGYLGHDDALRQIAGADVLVNFLDRERSETLLLSTKLWEYLATGKPIIAINPSRSDRLVLWRAQGVAVLRSPTPEQLTTALRTALRHPAGAHSERVEQFRRENNWRAQAQRLAGWFDEISSVTAIHGH